MDSDALASRKASQNHHLTIAPTLIVSMRFYSTEGCINHVLKFLILIKTK